MTSLLTVWPFALITRLLTGLRTQIARGGGGKEDGSVTGHLMDGMCFVVRSAGLGRHGERELGLRQIPV